MQYVEYTFKSESDDDGPERSIVYDLLSQHLIALHFDSFATTDESLLGYVPAKKAPADERLREHLLEFPLPNIHIAFTSKLLEDKNWNTEWELNSFKPVIIDDKVYIRAPFHPDSDDEDMIDLIINPKMAFGTGTHNTTHLIAQYLVDEKEDLEDKTILDMGCGTGILSILSLLLGAQSAMAIDIDSWAYENAIENANLNHLADKMTVLCGDASSARGLPNYDYVLANITREVLLQDLPVYCSHLKKNGKLIISGFLEDDVDVLVKAGEAHHLKVKEILRDKDWRGIVFKKKK